MNQRIHFRVEANSKIGYGHLIRCVAIANALTDEDVTFFSKENLEKTIKEHGSSALKFTKIETSEAFSNHLHEGDIVVLDGYEFSREYTQSIRSKGTKIVRIDDLAQEYIDADIIINPTPSFSANEYRATMYTQYFMGLDFAMLRTSFLELAKKEDLKKEVDSVLICFGGSDPLNRTEDALNDVIESNVFEKVHVVLGPGYNQVEKINEIASLHSFITTYVNLPEPEMVNLMTKTEYAILPSSGILLEGMAAKMRIISGYYIDNQRHVYERHLNLGSFTDAKNFSSKELRHAINEVKSTKRVLNSIDGKSIQRIVRGIKSLSLENECKLKKAKANDTETTFQWANDPEVRKYAFSKKEILWEDHTRWFENKLTQKNCWYGILEHNEVPVGSIRFDIIENKAIISYLVDPKQHGKGLGTLLIKLGLKALSENFDTTEIDAIHGEVFPSNIASIKTFDRFGFEKTEQKGVFLFIKKFSKDV